MNSSLIQYIYYDVWHQYQCPLVKDYPLMSTPWPLLLITGIYLTFVKRIGPQLMASRKPYDLRWPIRAFNALNVAVNFWGLYNFIPRTNFGLNVWRCPTLCENVDPYFAFLGYIFFLSRLAEFMDTVFFVLRKKDRQANEKNSAVCRPIYYFKILLVGDQNVGKSCLLNRLTNNSGDTLSPTMGVDFARKSMYIDECLVKFHFWDPSGDQRFRDLLPNYFSGINAVLFMYDICDEQSFVSLKDSWFPIIGANARPQPTSKLIIANKSDLSSDRVISVTQGIQLANQTNSLFMEVSAKSGHNVDNLLFIIGQQLISIQKQLNQQW
ncbi:unnamed protein product [Medioppia subpectinata]|uniref:Uncharacterized protein n=1 Tax=Medioppia subpectinata TaxID=1979941 RepID=A0A7R9KXP3_9ACAR|nr:unnamed protein product [Medioppia subpectinata]CAG2111762.1 unnamed protein product [Medioppia subpectinata]